MRSVTITRPSIASASRPSPGRMLEPELVREPGGPRRTSAVAVRRGTGTERTSRPAMWCSVGRKVVTRERARRFTERVGWDPGAPLAAVPDSRADDRAVAGPAIRAARRAPAEGLHRALRAKEPASAVSLHDEGWSPRIASGPVGAVLRLVVGRLLLVEVGESSPVHLLTPRHPTRRASSAPTTAAPSGSAEARL